MNTKVGTGTFFLEVGKIGQLCNIMPFDLDSFLQLYFFVTYIVSYEIFSFLD